MPDSALQNTGVQQGDGLQGSRTFRSDAKPLVLDGTGASFLDTSHHLCLPVQPRPLPLLPDAYFCSPWAIPEPHFSRHLPTFRHICLFRPRSTIRSPLTFI